METSPFIDFLGRKVIVTGASSGIGRAVAIELSRRGATLILMGRDEKRLQETAGLLETRDFQILPLDLRDHAKIFPAVKELAPRKGRIYGLCYSAGIVETRPLTSMKTEGLQQMLDVNLIGGLELAKVVCRRDIMEENEGSILFISSIYARVGMTGQIGYSSSKGAISAAARAMAIELARRNIRVNIISPGLVKTDMTGKAFSLLSEEQVKALEEAYPLGTGTPEEVARAAAFLLAPQNRWITGVDLVIDGGYTAR
jgi:NAD(P)-dependent dehydrogenase (short-subunit alcohol dehydrogenase family)